MLRPRLLAAATVAVTLSISASVPLPSENDRWTTIRLGDFVIYSCASDRVTRNIARELQLMYDGVAAVSRLNAQPEQPVSVFVFRDAKTFEPFSEAITGMSAKRIGGVFAGDSDVRFLMVNAHGWGVDRLVRHELMHWFVHNTSANDLPLWFDEGMAEFYSTFAPAAGKKLELGQPILPHIHRLRRHGLVPLVRFLQMDGSSPEFTDADRSHDVYAQSWLLVHYLMIGSPERHAHLERFLALLHNGVDPETASQQAFGTPLADLDTELRLYRDYNPFKLPVVKYSITIGEPAGVPDPVPASRATVLLAMGRTFASQPQTAAEAPVFLAEAAKADPTNGDVYAVQAKLAEQDGHWTDAAALLRKAVTLGTSDADAYVRYATLDARHDAHAARAALEKAVAMKPKWAGAWALLGAAYKDEGEFGKAIDALTRSLQIECRDDAAFDLASIYAMRGDSKAAVAVIDAYMKGSPMEDLAREVVSGRLAD